MNFVDDMLRDLRDLSGGLLLSDMLREVSRDTGLTIKQLTVQSPQNDPFRFDTPANHRNGQWFRDQMKACGLLNRPKAAHLRGIHYAVFMNTAIRPDNGQALKNDDDGWNFVSVASAAARWLNYVPFTKIRDARNEEPIIQLRKERSENLVYTGVSGGLSSEELDSLSVDFQPYMHAPFDVPEQRYHLVFFGEKTSLEDVLGPLAAHYDADLYLPSGEISHTLLYQMAETGAEDGREMVVLVFADCDPSGYQMAVSIGHKLRALQEGWFPDLNFRLIAPCLTVEQVRELRLPSTPLKATELRAWRAKHGVDQTEIDALATLQPNVLRRIVRESVQPYFDTTLARRVSEARDNWYAEAEPIFQAALAESDFEKASAEEQAKLEQVREIIRNGKDRLRGIVRGLDLKLPPIEVPEIDLDEPPDPLVSSEMLLIEHIDIMQDRKNYS